MIGVVLHPSILNYWSLFVNLDKNTLGDVLACMITPLSQSQKELHILAVQQILSNGLLRSFDQRICLLIERLGVIGEQEYLVGCLEDVIA